MQPRHAAPGPRLSARHLAGRLCILLAAALGTAGCAVQPAPDGVEAQILARSEGKSALAPASGTDAGAMVRNGLLTHPGLRAAASDVAAGADEVRVARAALFPSLGLSVGAGTGKAGSGDPALTLSGSQLLMDFGDTKRKVSIADVDLQISYLEFQRKVDEVLLELLTARNDVNRLEELHKIRRSHLTASRELEALMASRSEAGATADSDLLETRKRLQSSEFLLLDVELELAEARDTLQRLAGQSRGGALPALPGECRRSGQSDAEKLAVLRHVKAGMQLERAERERLPSIRLSPLVRAETGSGATLGMNVSLGSDLLEGGAISARASAAARAQDAAKAAIEEAGRESLLSDRRRTREMSSSRQRAAMLERQIALLAETRALYRSQYFDLGTRQLTDLLDNEDDFYGRQADLVESRSDLVLARLGCAAQGGGLRGILALEGSSLYGFPLGRDDGR